MWNTSIMQDGTIEAAAMSSDTKAASFGGSANHSSVAVAQNFTTTDVVVVSTQKPQAEAAETHDAVRPPISPSNPSSAIPDAADDPAAPKPCPVDISSSNGTGAPPSAESASTKDVLTQDTARPAAAAAVPRAPICADTAPLTPSRLIPVQLSPRLNQSPQVSAPTVSAHSSSLTISNTKVAVDHTQHITSDGTGTGTNSLSSAEGPQMNGIGGVADSGSYAEGASQATSAGSSSSTSMQDTHQNLKAIDTSQPAIEKEQLPTPADNGTAKPSTEEASTAPSAFADAAATQTNAASASTNDKAHNDMARNDVMEVDAPAGDDSASFTSSENKKKRTADTAIAATAQSNGEPQQQPTAAKRRAPSPSVSLPAPSKGSSKVLRAMPSQNFTTEEILSFPVAFSYRIGSSGSRGLRDQAEASRREAARKQKQWDKSMVCSAERFSKRRAGGKNYSKPSNRRVSGAKDAISADTKKTTVDKKKRNGRGTRTSAVAAATAVVADRNSNAPKDPQKARSRSSNHHPAPKEVFSGPGPNLPAGWTMKIFERPRGDGGKGKRRDKFWFTPATGRRVRTQKEAERFQEVLDSIRSASGASAPSRGLESSAIKEEEAAWELFRR